ncbi:MAG TPA: ABC transporter permease [Mariniphaga anaerophila]|uniref:ABC transporter permease n=1 Tax=Mariniphaga anaerophila TaxID=1484053 RepID=A0A831PQN1_9BACT|nr:ABC transporter permease [Mariniphaga anaerophila]
MNKTMLILQQEYLKKVKKKSFIILTLLVPLLFVGMFALIIFLSMHDDKQERTIAVYDESTLFLGELEPEGTTQFHFVPKEKYDTLRTNLKGSEFYAILFIPENVYSNNTAQIISEKQLPIDLIERIARRLSRFIENDKRQKVIDEAGIPDLDERLAETRTSVRINTLKVSETGEARKSSSEVAFIASYAMGFIIYFFVFMYGASVMRSVMEEKKNRIVEVIISSVKPFQLMTGKIIGTALVGLTQVGIWIVVGLILMVVGQSFFTPESAQQMSQSLMESNQQMGTAVSQDVANNQMAEIIELIGNLNIPLILFSFLFYFLAGYLMYSSLLGAVGAAVDNEEDSQQMVFPITFPLILAIMILFPIARNPEGPIAFWGSIIPFTSPVAMLARVPYGVPAWELLLSMGLLILATIGAIWAAAKIYKTGLLMYGKKVNLKELIKWLTYKS